MSDEDFKIAVLNHIDNSKVFQQNVSVALFGDEKAEIPGLAKRVKETEKYISRDKKIKWMGAGIIAFIAWWKSLG